MILIWKLRYFLVFLNQNFTLLIFELTAIFYLFLFLKIDNFPLINSSKILQFIKFLRLHFNHHRSRLTQIFAASFVVHVHKKTVFLLILYVSYAPPLLSLWKQQLNISKKIGEKIFIHKKIWEDFGVRGWEKNVYVVNFEWFLFVILGIFEISFDNLKKIS